MTEEQLTKTILNWLEKDGWNIVCFDFPQSGTGVSLHPNEEIRTTKNKGAIIPDIVAIKGDIVVFFENKDHFSMEDFLKVEQLRKSPDYSNSIKNLLRDLIHTKIFYGVGLPFTNNIHNKTKENINRIDFAVFVSANKSISVLHSAVSIF